MRTALVTGASRGIGKAIAECLAAQGLQIFLTYVSKAHEAEAVVQGICDKGGKARAFCLNVGDAEAVSQFFATHIKEPVTRGEISFDALVNNAGITKDGFLVRMKDADFDSVLQVNLRGSFVCLREAAKIMTKQRRGSIVNISSVVGQMGNAGQLSYAAAKAGLHGLTMSAAKELAARNITVNTVAPGFIETDMTAGLSQEVRDAYAAGIPLKRMGTPEDVAHAVAFLVSEKATYITGQLIAVNGGMYC